jgi:hypothetical protein
MTLSKNLNLLLNYAEEKDNNLDEGYSSFIVIPKGYSL